MRESWDWEGSGLGANTRWKEDVAGQMIEGWRVITDYVPNQKIVWINTGDFQGAWTWLLLPHPQGTKVISIIDYAIQLPADSKVPKEAVSQEGLQAFLDGNLKGIKAAVEKK